MHPHTKQQLETRSRIGRNDFVKNNDDLKLYNRIHYWLKNNYGKASKCENIECSGISKIYDWALKINCVYEKDRDSFIMLCRSCHLKYDWTDKRTKRAIEVIHSLQSRKKAGDAKKGRPLPPHVYEAIKIANRRRIIGTYQNGETKIFGSLTEAAKELGCSICLVHDCLSGRNKYCKKIMFKYV